MLTSTALCLSVIMAVVINAQSTTPAPLPADGTNLCYFMFGDPSDLGWTFQFNVGRSNTHSLLRKAFPRLNINSIAVPNVFFGVANKSAYAEAWIAAGCACIITNNNALLGSVSDHAYLQTKYPNTCFIHLNEEAYQQPRYPNFQYYQFDATAGFYYAGVVAALQRPNKIGFLAAWEEHRNPVEAVNGFLFGVASVNASLPVEIVNMNTWYDPDNEAIAAKLLLQKRHCTILARYSDPHTVDTYVSQLGDPSVFSVGSHSDLQLYIGDSVLSSVFVTWEVMLVPMLTSWLSTRAFSPSLPVAYGVIEGVVTPSKVSPVARKGVAASADAVLAKLLSDTPFVVCGRSLTTWTGAPVAVDPVSGCVTPAQSYNGFVRLPNGVYFGGFQLPTQCPGGSSYSYDTTSNLTLVCTVCPPNTYAVSGSASCTVCPLGTYSPGNASSCTVVPSAAGSVNVAAIAAPIIIVCVSAVAVVVGAIARSRANARSTANAPTCGRVTIMFSDIQDSTRLWGALPMSMNKALGLHHELIRAAIAKHKGYEVKTIGDSFMIAVSSEATAVQMAVDIQRSLQAASWPPCIARAYAAKSDEELELLDDDPAAEPIHDAVFNGLRVRIGIHSGEPKAELDPVTKGYDYYGPMVNVAARVESAAKGGQICCSTDVITRLPDKTGLALRSLGAVELKGVAEAVELMEVMPEELAASRRFAYGDTATKDVNGAFDGSDLISDSASSVHSDGDTAAVRPQIMVSCFLRSLLKTVPSAEAKKLRTVLFKAWHVPEDHHAGTGSVRGDADLPLERLCKRVLPSAMRQAKKRAEGEGRASGSASSKQTGVSSR